MILAIDVYYIGDRANVVGVLFDEWTQSEPSKIISIVVDGIAEYEPGNFYKRELPCILELLKEVKDYTITCIVVDGYVFLDDKGKKGLGYYLYEALDSRIPIIGVAKSYFAGNNSIEVCRGESKKPLYVTSIGVDQRESAHFIETMYGEFRMPTLLKILDTATRDIDLTELNT